MLLEKFELQVVYVLSYYIFGLTFLFKEMNSSFGMFMES